MKKIEAIIRKSQFDEVKDALHEAGIDFFTCWDVTGIGNEKAGSIFRATVYETRFIERRMISFVCRDHLTDKAIQAIIDSAKTGEMGDGKSSYPMSKILSEYVPANTDLNHSISKNNHQVYN